MQCNQSFCGNGYPNFGPTYTYNPPPVPCNGPSPEIIGEGDVTSLVLPDGSVQYFFTPTTKWWSPYMTLSPLLNPNNPFWHTNTGIWFVRSFPNPIPPYAFNQQCNINDGLPFPRPGFSSECNINSAPPPFHLKFHNDCCTSTTDLHYFFPSIRRQCISNFPTHGSAAVQVQLINPNTTVTPNVSAISYKPCHCAVKASTKCACKLSDKCSSMSIDEKELSKNVTKTSRCRCAGKGNSATECGCKKSASSISLRDKKSKNPFKRLNLHATSSSSVSTDVKKNKHSKKVRNDKNRHTCECSSLLTTDKSVTTYMDQASGCSAEKGRETQTVDDCHPVPIIPFIDKVHFSGNCDSECSASSCDCNHCCE